MVVWHLSGKSIVMSCMVWVRGVRCPVLFTFSLVKWTGQVSQKPAPDIHGLHASHQKRASTPKSPLVEPPTPGCIALYASSMAACRVGGALSGDWPDVHVDGAMGLPTTTTRNKSRRDGTVRLVKMEDIDERRRSPRLPYLSETPLTRYHPVLM